MIVLSQVGIARSLNQPILRRCSMSFAPLERVGILAAPGTGKSSLARLISGIDWPDTGAVLHGGSVSWPIGFAGFLHPEMTVAKNLGSVAQLKGHDPAYVLSYCQAFLGQDGLLARKVKHLTPTERASVAFACSMAIPTDYTIADETVSVGDMRMRKKSEAAFENRIKTSGLILISRNPRQILRYCTRFLVLLNGELKAVPDLDIAADALTRWVETKEWMTENA